MGFARRIVTIIVALVTVTLFGVVGYVLLGFPLLDAVYQTVTTLATVGYREVHPLTTVGQVFTMVLIVLGVGTVLYSITLMVGVLVEGEVRRYVGRRRMDRHIRGMDGHVIVCGYGRVGRATTDYLRATGIPVVVVDRDEGRLAGLHDTPHLVGDVTNDATLREAGIARARALVAALDTDQDTVYVVLSARALRHDLVIVARARTAEARDKMVLAGATRAVNPQLIGGRRIAAFALQPDVADFLDVVMQDDEFDYRIQQVSIPDGSPFVGHTVGDLDLQERCGATVLAVRRVTRGPFTAHPAGGVRLEPGSVLITYGTSEQLEALERAAGVGR